MTQHSSDGSKPADCKYARQKSAERRHKASAQDELNRIYASEEAEDRRSLRYAILAAVALHVAFLFSAIPTFQSSQAEPAEKPKAFVVKTTRFEKPTPPVTEKPKPRQRVREIPVPDPDPDNDLYVADVEPDIDLQIDDIPTFALPDAPPAPEPAEEPGIVRVGGKVSPPVRSHYVDPAYPPLARRARIQGTVVLEATIDTRGQVVDLVVVRGQPMGLTQSALDAVSKWRFEPSKLGGVVVPVLYRVEVTFTLR